MSATYVRKDDILEMIERMKAASRAGVLVDGINSNRNTDEIGTSLAFATAPLDVLYDAVNELKGINADSVMDSIMKQLDNN